MDDDPYLPIIALADALREAGVEVGYVGGEVFRQAVARSLLSSAWLREAKAEAWDEGRQATLDLVLAPHEGKCGVDHVHGKNPYRD